ncbi:MAG: hypothetical protein PHW46_04350 [Candidatus Omnitrophica bacterium]|nr:hypothetical protein [Candidatus Omnitrophota bacterium]
MKFIVTVFIIVLLNYPVWQLAEAQPVPSSKIDSITRESDKSFREDVEKDTWKRKRKKVRIIDERDKAPDTEDKGSKPSEEKNNDSVPTITIKP